MSAAAEELRLFELLSGQKEAFERIARGEPLLEVLTAIVRTIEALARSGSKASILLADEDGRHLLHGAAPGLPADLNAAIDGIAVGEGIGSCGTAAARRTTVVVTDVLSDPLWTDFRHLATRAGVRACWSMPILGADGRLLGTSAVYHPEPESPSERDLAVMAAFSQTAAVAIERERDVAALVRAKRNAEALQQVGQAIARRLDLHDIVQVATDAATDLTAAQFGAFFYNVERDDGEAYLLYTLSGAPRSAFERFPHPRPTAIFGPTFEGTHVVRLDDVTLAPEFGQNAPYSGMPEGHLPVRAYLAVPVKTSDGAVAGGLFFGHPEAGVFGEEAEHLAVGIAAQAAVAIENARLYEAAQREIVKRKAAFEERDRVARTLQESLLPPELPRVPGMQLAARYHATTEDLGGDFYDAFPLPGGRWGLVVGDVCGKGVEAARLTSLARHTVHTAAMLDPRPSEVLRVLNTALVEQDRDLRFCTVAFALLEPDDSGGPCLTVALGGHPHALLLRGGAVERVGRPGRLLGIYPEPDVHEASVRLEDGDVVVLHTDGLTDVVRDGEPLGDAWVHETLRAAAGGAADAVAGALGDGGVERQAGLTRTDDIAVLALSVG